MKIGIYSPYLNTLGGGERYMLSIALCLSQEHEVFILWDDKEIVQKALDRFGLDLTRVKVAVNVFDRSVNIIERLRKVNKYDLVIVLSDGSIPLFWEKKAVLHFQQPFKHVEGTSFINQMKLKRVVSIICNSNYTKRFIDGEFNVTSKVLYPPVDIESFKSNGIKKKLIVTVGRIQPVKKHEVLIDAFYRFKAKIPGWKMIVAGGLMDQDRKYYEYLEKKKGADVTIIPNVPFMQLKQLYQEASFYWHAAGFGEDEKIHPERFEHFGISPVEAMAASAIPMLYNGGGLSEIVHGQEEALLWKTEDELIDKTSTLIKNNGPRVSVSKWAASRSQEFSIERFCNRLKQLLY